jgi:hypothetical protein
VKLGDVVVGSTFVFPASKTLIDQHQNVRRSSDEKRRDKLGEEELFRDKRERELFKEVKAEAVAWDCLYLAEATILPRHQRRGLAFKSFCETIDDIAERHPDTHIEIFGWPEGLEQTKLFEKLREHYKGRITVKKLFE